MIEQQPGPVNWARHNPAPLPGMVRLWTLEALARGAQLVSYFRWRQAAHAQEQMHAGLLRPDGVAAAGLAEVQQVAPRLRTTHDYLFAFNYSSALARLLDNVQGEAIIGRRDLPPAGVAVLRGN